MKLLPGDLVKVINYGCSYDTHWKMARILGADVNKDLSTNTFKRHRHQDTNRWVLGALPRNGITCTVENTHKQGDEVFVLIRDYAGQQYVIGIKGLRFIKRKDLLDEDLFEL